MLRGRFWRKWKRAIVVGSIVYFFKDQIAIFIDQIFKKKVTTNPPETDNQT